jgi:hypothetical protein
MLYGLFFKQEVIMAKTLQLSVLGELLQYLRPKYSDWGPELPNVNVGKFKNVVALNPQPLPPISNIGEAGAFSSQRPQVHEIADMFLSRILIQLDTLEYQGKEEQKQAVQVMSRQATLLAGWCGSEPRNERIRELLKKLRWRFPNWQSLLITAGLFAHAATIAGHEELSAALNKGAESIADAAIKQGGLGQLQGIAA